MSFHTQQPRREKHGATTLLPTDHGPGEPVVAGALATLLERLVKAGGAISPSLGTGYVVPFDPEIFKLVALDLLDEARVDFLFHAFAADVFASDDKRNVVLETKSGPLVIRAHVVIDCTGDGDVAARAGAPYEIGREEDGLVQPMTLVFRITEFDHAGFDPYLKQHPDQWRGVHGLWDLIRKAAAEGKLRLPREDVVQSGVNIGVRETRRILGDYQLTADDILQARKFPDVIARSTYPVDIHNPEGTGTLLKRLPPGEA